MYLKCVSLTKSDSEVYSLAFGRVYYNRGPQRSYTRTCTILQETINGFLCSLVVFLKTHKTHRLNLEGRD